MSWTACPGLEDIRPSEMDHMKLQRHMGECIKDNPVMVGHRITANNEEELEEWLGPHYDRVRETAQTAYRSGGQKEVGKV